MRTQGVTDSYHVLVGVILAKDIGKYKALDKWRVSIAPIVLCYREARKFPECPRSLTCEEFGKCFDALTAIIKSLDS